MDMSLFMSSSVSAGLLSFEIFKTSLISLLPVFHIAEAICITMFWGSFLIIMTDKGYQGSSYNGTN
jgi:hypothetical protein